MVKLFLLIAEKLKLYHSYRCRDALEKGDPPSFCKVTPEIRQFRKNLLKNGYDLNQALTKLPGFL